MITFSPHVCIRFVEHNFNFIDSNTTCWGSCKLIHKPHRKYTITAFKVNFKHGFKFVGLCKLVHCEWRGFGKNKSACMLKTKSFQHDYARLIWLSNVIPNVESFKIGHFLCYIKYCISGICILYHCGKFSNDTSYE